MPKKSTTKKKSTGSSASRMKAKPKKASSTKASNSKVKKAPVSKVKKASAKAVKVIRLTKERSNAVGASIKGFGSSSKDYAFSGKFTVRLPKSLHQALVDRSKKEGVSLNLFVTNALSRTVASKK